MPAARSARGKRLADARIAATDKRQSFPGQTFINANTVFGDKLEVAAVATARLARRIAHIEHHHAQPAVANGIPEVERGRSTGYRPAPMMTTSAVEGSDGCD